MWYILKPILICLFALIYMIWKSIEFIFFFSFILIFLFEWSSYSELNNNEGELICSRSGITTVNKDSTEYYECKNPYDSWIQLYNYFKEK